MLCYFNVSVSSQKNSYYCCTIIHNAPQCQMSHGSLSESLSESAISWMQFLNAMPLQPLHAEMHFTPFFLQLHRRVLQSPVQLQLVNRSNSSGAIGSSVGIGSYPSTHSHWDSKTYSAEAASLQGLETGTERVLCSCALCRGPGVEYGMMTPVATLYVRTGCI